MPDRKYDKPNDRNYTLLDAKQRVIDLMANNQPLPEVGIYDEPVRYFKANEQWCAVIFGWLAWLEDVAGWQDAEDESHPGIQAILIFEEGIEAGMATEDDIARGMYKAFNWIALQIGSGSYQNVNIVTDADGVISLPPASDGGVTLPEDDPATAINETKGGKYGAALAVARAIEYVWDTVDAQYGATNGSPATTEADTKSKMRLLFPCDPDLMDSAVTIYYAYRVSAPRFIYDQAVSFPQYLYCKGINSAIAQRYFAEVINFTQPKASCMNNFIVALSDEFFSYYSNAGAQAPSSAYLEAGCEPSPTEIIVIASGGVTYTTNTAWKANHRLRITVSPGYFVDSSSPQKLSDFWWYSFPPAIPANHISATNIQQGTGIAKPTVNQVPYASGHGYQFTMDTATAGAMQITVPVAGMTAPITSPTSGITVTIVDLGEYIG